MSRQCTLHEQAGDVTTRHEQADDSEGLEARSPFGSPHQLGIAPGQADHEEQVWKPVKLGGIKTQGALGWSSS